MKMKNLQKQKSSLKIWEIFIQKKKISSRKSLKFNQWSNSFLEDHYFPQQQIFQSMTFRMHSLNSSEQENFTSHSFFQD